MYVCARYVLYVTLNFSLETAAKLPSRSNNCAEMRTEISKVSSVACKTNVTRIYCFCLVTQRRYRLAAIFARSPGDLRRNRTPNRGHKEVTDSSDLLLPSEREGASIYTLSSIDLKQLSITSVGPGLYTMHAFINPFETDFVPFLVWQ